VLWKLSSAEEPGWDSPWGRGRPGWHIECSAMSKQYLGEVFDIHGGGLDLIFPHHENEIAQSRCVHGTDVMANVWMHNGFLQVEGQKMSKSLGNFYTIADLLETEKFGGRKWSGSVLRLAMLKTHYRQPIDWTIKTLEEAETNLSEFGQDQNTQQLSPPSDFFAALMDDLNTWQCFTILQKLKKEKRFGELAASMKFLGIPQAAVFSGTASIKFSAKGAFTSGSTYSESIAQTLGVSDSTDAFVLTKAEAEKIGSLVSARLAARSAKNWNESDRIRDELEGMGVSIKDNKDGTTSWEVKR
jgi:cysteinyl-tRNA synthetase